MYSNIWKTHDSHIIFFISDIHLHKTSTQKFQVTMNEKMQYRFDADYPQITKQISSSDTIVYLYFNMLETNVLNRYNLNYFIKQH